MPGSPLDPRCRGSNDLLRNGATLTESAADVLAQLGPLLQRRGRRRRPRMRRPRIAAGIARCGRRAAGDARSATMTALELILEKLGPTPVAVDELVRQCQLSAAAVATLLLELELAGRVERHPGNLVSLPLTRFLQRSSFE